MPDSVDYTQLVVVRHGETEWNREGRYMNHLDSPLSELGQRQATALAKRLSGMKFDAIYSSDLGRALATAKIITDLCGGEVGIEQDLREHALGLFQGLTHTEILERYPEERARTHSDPDYTIPGGESARKFHERVTRGFESIVKRHPGQSVLVVCHGGTLETLFRHALNIPLEAPRPVRALNCCVNVFHVYDTHWVLSTWGDTSHLADL